LHGPVCLLLNDERARAYTTAADEFANVNFDQVAPKQLAVDRKAKERPITEPALAIEPKPDRQTCCGLSARFAPSFRPSLHGRRSAKAGSYSECPIIVLYRS
jgi:hypothetical protein